MTDSPNTTPLAILCREDEMPWRIAKPLYESQREFNYLEETLLRDACSIQDGRIHLEDNAYSIVLVEEDLGFTPETVRRLDEFALQGGTIIRLREKGNEDRIPLAKAAAVGEPDGVVSILDKLIGPTVYLTPRNAHLRVSHIVKEGQPFFLLVNEGEEDYEGTVTLPVIGKAEAWKAWSGEITGVPAVSADDGGLTLPVELGRRESILYRILPDEDPVISGAKKSPRPPSIQYLQEGWKAEAPSFPAAPPSLGSWSQLDKLKHVSGTVTYRKSFDRERGAQDERIRLDLGEVGEIAEVQVNGQEAGILLWAPYRLDITPYLRAGRNELEIRVTNSLANRLDESPLPAGLIGPVVLETYR
ncbi:hypothetical protein N6H14_28365 [Paenibacillus sp. CC-CFT747]|nr:hypothetical protein N6H14_28365 [Paenibacillus sp. CC-CFT747]